MVLETNKGNTMNSQAIVDLMLDGAYLNVGESKLYHASFRKGWVKMLSSNMSFMSAQSKLAKMGKLVQVKTDDSLIIKAI